MATTTPNLGLTLPIGSEKVSRQILNGNFSLIDTAYGTLNSNLTAVDISNQFTNLNSKVSQLIAYANNYRVDILIKVDTGITDQSALCSYPTKYDPKCGFALMTSFCNNAADITKNVMAQARVGWIELRTAATTEGSAGVLLYGSWFY